MEQDFGMNVDTKMAETTEDDLSPEDRKLLQEQDAEFMQDSAVDLVVAAKRTRLKLAQSD